MDGKVNPFQRGHGEESGAIAYEQGIIGAEFGYRVIPALGQCFCPVLNHLAPFQELSDKRVCLPYLKSVVRIESGVCVIQSYHQSQRHLVIL